MGEGGVKKRKKEKKSEEAVSSPAFCAKSADRKIQINGLLCTGMYGPEVGRVYRITT